MTSPAPWAGDPITFDDQLGFDDPVEFDDVAFPDHVQPAPTAPAAAVDPMAEMDRLAASVKPHPVAPPPPVPEPEPAQLVYATVDRFVAEVLSPMFARPVDGRHLTWCPSWWKHAEALTRLEALWRAWEHLRLDPATGMSVWLRDHADHHLRVLMDPELGPFKGCHPERGHGERLHPLPLEPPPAALFDP